MLLIDYSVSTSSILIWTASTYKHAVINHVDHCDFNLYFMLSIERSENTRCADDRIQESLLWHQECSR